MLAELGIKQNSKMKPQVSRHPRKWGVLELKDVLEGIPAFGDTARHATAVNLLVGGGETCPLGVLCSGGDARRLGANKIVSTTGAASARPDNHGQGCHRTAKNDYA